MKGKGSSWMAVLFVIVFVAFILIFQAELFPRYVNDSNKKTLQKGHFIVTILKIGKADAILLETMDYVMLIDTGEQEDAEEILELLNKKEIHKIDALIITHFDKDHVGGADQIIENIIIDRIYQPFYETDSQQYQEYRDAIEAAEVETIYVRENISFEWNDVFFEINSPKGDSYKEENDYSIVIKAVHEENYFLFVGDAEEKRLQELLEEGMLKSTVLKVPHHGRAEENSEEFLKEVNPEYAIITCSKKNPPDKEILSILKSLGTKVFLTKDGTVIIDSDGENILTKQK